MTDTYKYILVSAYVDDKLCGWVIYRYTRDLFPELNEVYQKFELKMGKWKLIFPDKIHETELLASIVKFVETSYQCKCKVDMCNTLHEIDTTLLVYAL